MRVLSSNSFRLVIFCLLFTSACIYAKAQELGVAVDPLKIQLKPNDMVYFTVTNDTENDYIVTTKIISDLAIKSTVIGPKLLVNPPLRLLKKRDRAKMGVVYLQDRLGPLPGLKFYLSVSFVPKTLGNLTSTNIPVILEQQIPLVFN